MKKSEKAERVQEVWSEYNAVLKARQEKEKEVKALKEREEGLKGELCSLVPENDSFAGVEHKVWSKPSVQYSKVYDAVVKELVPKTKWEKAEELKESFTSVRVQHSVKGAE